MYTSPLPFYENSFTSHLRHNDDVVFSISNLSYESTFFFPNIRTSLLIWLSVSLYPVRLILRDRDNRQGITKVRRTIVCVSRLPVRTVYIHSLWRMLLDSLSFHHRRMYTQPCTLTYNSAAWSYAIGFRLNRQLNRLTIPCLLQQVVSFDIEKIRATRSYFFFAFAISSKANPTFPSFCAI